MFKSHRLLFSPESTAAAPAAPVTTTSAGSSTASVTSAPIVAPATTAATPATTPAAAPAVTPTEIKLTLPEGSFMQPADLEKITAFAKERNLTPEQAQAVVDREHTQRAEFQSSVTKQMEDQNKSWLGELKSDPSVGGTKWKETEANVRRAFELGDPTGEFRKALEESKLSYHPGLVKFLSVIGAARKEDSLTAPTTIAPGKDNRSWHERAADSLRKQK